MAISENTYAQFYSGSQMDFGKNRIQYKDELWSHYKFDKFDVYFYLGGKNLAVYTAKIAESQIENIEQVLDFQAENRIQFIVYNKQSDYLQSNIGLVSGSQQYNVGGVTRIVGNKIILYYEGDHDKFTKQIKAGLAEMYFNTMMYGGNWKDVVRNSTLLNIPEWYSKGFASYYSNNWNPEIENKIKDGMMSGNFKDINRLPYEDAIIAGHSVWSYIAETYGKNVIPNLLYMTRVSRNIESGFLFVLGLSMKSVLNEWRFFYSNKFIAANNNRDVPNKEFALKIKNKKGKIFSQFKLSPNGKWAVYSTNWSGQYKIYLYDIENNKTTRILKKGAKISRANDYSYPVIAWHPSSEFFTFINEDKGQLWLNFYTLKDKELEKRVLQKFEKVIQFNYAPDGKKFVMSAVQNGMTDIFVYQVGSNNAEQITKDVYDDLYPAFYKGTSEIIFSSNRTNDTLKFSDDIDPVAPFYDLFSYDYLRRTPVIRRLTETPFINETQTQVYDSSHIVFLSDHNGIVNRFIGNFDSVLAYVDTSEHYRYKMNYYPISNKARNILEHNFIPNQNNYSEVQLFDGNYYLTRQTKIAVNELIPLNLTNTPYRELSKKVNIIPSSPSPLEKPKEQPAPVEKEETPHPQDTAKSQEGGIKIRVFDSNNTGKEKVDINNYTFSNESPKKETKQESYQNSPFNKANTSTVNVTEQNDTNVRKRKEFLLPHQLNYNRFFTIDQLVSQIDNQFLNANYQVFSGGGPIYYNPGFNGLIKVGASDLFENYRLTGGFRLGTNLKSNEFMAGIEDLSKRLDKSYTYFRRNINTAGGEVVSGETKTLTQEFKYAIRYPFSELLALKGTSSARVDRLVYLSTNDANLKKQSDYTYWANLKAELIYDNTSSLGLNLPVGFKAKAFAEYYRQVSPKQVNIGVIGADVRYYLKIYREFIWANRLATSTSFGNQKLIYYMGGVDNWLFPKYNGDVLIKNPNQYAFQTLATNMRGFAQNSRNGNSFALLNSEFRLPLFRFMSSQPLRSEFVNNFQFILFSDVGTAWTGKSPFSPENSIFSTVIAPANSPFEITLENQLNPIITSYGWGVRSKILGYFVRVDFGYGIQDGIQLKRVIQLSLNTDF